MCPEADGDEPVFIKLVDVVPASAGILLFVTPRSTLYIKNIKRINKLVDLLDLTFLALL